MTKKSFDGIVVELNDVSHQYCIKCKNIMLYHKDNQVCLNCDTG